MALNTNIPNGPRSFRDLGSERARTEKAITKALKALGKTQEEAALESLQKTIRSLPQPGGMWTMERPKIDWQSMFVRGSVTLGVTPPPSIPEPERFEPQFRVETSKRMGLWIPSADYMRQETLAFPPIEESFLFRVEHAEAAAYVRPLCRGPYADRVTPLDDVPYTKMVNGVDTTPSPYHDPKLMSVLSEHGGLSGRHFFGFKSLDALMSWFSSPKFHASCVRAGYVVRRYRGVVFHGGFQSVIDTKYQVRRVDTLHPW